LGYRNGLLEAGFGFEVIVRRLLQQVYAFEPMEF
jgi:hypothetical protein